MKATELGGIKHLGGFLTLCNSINHIINFDVQNTLFEDSFNVPTLQFEIVSVVQYPLGAMFYGARAHINVYTPEV